MLFIVQVQFPEVHHLIILSEHTLETERLGPGEVSDRAVVDSISCGSGGTLGALSGASSRGSF